MQECISKVRERSFSEVFKMQHGSPMSSFRNCGRESAILVGYGGTKPTCTAFD